MQQTTIVGKCFNQNDSHHDRLLNNKATHFDFYSYCPRDNEFAGINRSSQKPDFKAELDKRKTNNDFVMINGHKTISDHPESFKQPSKKEEPVQIQIECQKSTLQKSDKYQKHQFEQSSNFKCISQNFDEAENTNLGVSRKQFLLNQSGKSLHETIKKGCYNE